VSAPPRSTTAPFLDTGRATSSSAWPAPRSGPLVERTSRFTMLLHLLRMERHGHGVRVKHGPALAGHGAEAVHDAIAASITTLPEQLRWSLTWDHGKEMAQHAQLRIDTGLAVYFCDPHSLAARHQREHQRPAALSVRLT
jgi:IS30 family transposase